MGGKPGGAHLGVPRPLADGLLVLTVASVFGYDGCHHLKWRVSMALRSRRRSRPFPCAYALRSLGSEQVSNSRGIQEGTTYRDVKGFPAVFFGLVRDLPRGERSWRLGAGRPTGRSVLNALSVPVEDRKSRSLTES